MYFDFLMFFFIYYSTCPIYFNLLLYSGLKDWRRDPHPHSYAIHHSPSFIGHSHANFRETEPVYCKDKIYISERSISVTMKLYHRKCWSSTWPWMNTYNIHHGKQSCVNVKYLETLSYFDHFLYIFQILKGLKNYSNISMTEYNINMEANTKLCKIRYMKSRQ